MRAILFSTVALVLVAGPALAREPNPRQLACSATWKAHKSDMIGVHKTWPKFWSVCNTTLKAGGDESAVLKAGPKVAKGAITDSEVEGLVPVPAKR